MERLTQKSINYCAEICRAQDCETYHGVRNDVCGDAAIYNRLAAYEDLEEQGRLIVLPCKVGDTVWDRELEAWNVISIEWFSRKVTHLHCVSPVTGRRHTFSVGKRSLGKTVFLSRAEAEAALKGVSEDA